MDRAFLMLILLFSLSGCTKYYYNAKYPNNEQQRYFAGDHGYCLQVSHGAAPMPQLQANTTSGYYLSGSGSDSSGKTYRYQGTVTPQPNPIGSFMDGWNIGNAIATAEARGDIYEGCLIRLGWVPIPCKTCIPVHAGAQVQNACQALEADGFDERIVTTEGNSAFYFKKGKIKREGDLIIVDVALVPLKDISYTEDGITYSPLYTLYEYQINKKLGYYKVSKMASYDKTPKKVLEKQYPDTAMPTYYFGKNSIIDIFLNKI